MFKRLNPGEKCPPLYGLYRYDFRRTQYCVAPVPLNLLLGVLVWLIVSLRTAWVRICINPADAFVQGKRDSHEHWLRIMNQLATENRVAANSNVPAEVEAEVKA